MIRGAALYWHTIRHLRPVQIGARIRAGFPRAVPVAREAPALRPPTGRWTMPAQRAPSMKGPMTFEFLGEQRAVGGSPWGVDAPSDLWRYNLHYFDDLNAEQAEARRAWHEEAIARWVRDNPPGQGAGWDPYPTSLRVVNWIKWHLGGGRSEALRESLALQARHLERRIEYHLLGNHLLANAKALVFAGLFFTGPEAQRWLERGSAILRREIDEQVLEDGGHFERSTMYHALVFEDFLDLLNVFAAFPDAADPALVERLADAAQRMAHWLVAMSHPDGEISFFNDAALGIAPAPSRILGYGAAIGAWGDVPAMSIPGMTHLRESGYVRAEVGNAVLLVDAAPIGPDYLPGHAHADTLSFEWSVFGQRVVVNGGTSTYAPGEVRGSERGTAAHSTVVVDAADSSEVWASFRVARRARPIEFEAARSPEGVRIACAHDGYRRLGGDAVHRREWRLEDGALVIEDRVRGRYASAVARFHLHPSVSCAIDEAGCSGRLRLAGGQEIRWSAAGGAARLERSFHAQEFGCRVPTQCIAVPIESAQGARMRLEW